jgi:hypothetical protein
VKIYLVLSVPLALAATAAAHSPSTSLSPHTSLPPSTSLIKVGPNACPPSQPNCDPRGAVAAECTGALKDACPGADSCTDYYTFTEYECGCDKATNDACSDENAECLPGYRLERMDEGAGSGSVGGNGRFYACNCVDDRYCDVVYQP